MKSIAEFKRRLKIGVEVSTIYHRWFTGRDENGFPIYIDKDKGIRKVSIVQSNSFALITLNEHPDAPPNTYRNSWMEYPAREDVEFIGENTIKIFETDTLTNIKVPVLTYTFI